MVLASRANLAPHGVAYVSYNTYPGWRMREAVRDMVVFHTRRSSDPTATSTTGSCARARRSPSCSC